MLLLIRIAAAGFFLAATAASVCLWVRSYSVIDSAWSGKPYASFMSCEGLIIINVTGNPLFDRIRWSDFFAHYESHAVEPQKDPPWWEKESVLGFGFTQLDGKRIWVNFPFWLPTLLLGAVGTALAFGFPRRFNLRACFITMTAVAILLGVGAYMQS